MKKIELLLLALIAAGYLWFMRVLVAFDQFCNVVLGGMPDETISARVGRLYRSSHLARAVRWTLNHLQPHHTQSAIEHDKERAEAVVKVESSIESK